MKKKHVHHLFFGFFGGAGVALAAVLFVMLGYDQSVLAATTAWLVPTSNGAYQEWSVIPNLASHYTTVDETPCNSTDYVYTSTKGKRDSYGISLGSIPNGSTIQRINIMPCTGKASAGSTTSTLEIFYRWNGVDGTATSVQVTSTAFQTKYASINTSLLKGVSSALQIGIRYAFGNEGLKVSNLQVQFVY